MKTDIVHNSDAVHNEAADRKPIGKILFALGIGTFMSALDSSVVNIALPRIGSYFGISLSIVEWVVMAYLLVISSLLLTYGRLGDMYGHKRIYLTGFVIFTAGSLLCGMAPGIMPLIVFRGIQAAGAGMIMAIGPAIVTAVTPPQQRGRSLGLIAVAVSVALTTGPVLGGLLTSAFGWQSIFYINIPIGILGTLYAARVIPETGEKAVQPFDKYGAAAVFLALLCLLVPLSYTEKFGWRNPYILLSLFAGLCLLGAFILIEKRIAYPMVDLDLFRSRLFSMSNISALLNYMAQFTIILLMPFYLQQLLGLPPSKAGLFMIPMPLVTMLAAPLSGALSDRVDSRYISSAGMAVTVLGIWQISALDAASSPAVIIAAMATVGLGSGIFQTPNNSAIMGCVPPSRRGIASGLLATMRNLGMVLGVAVSGALFSGRLHHLQAVFASETLSEAQLWELAFTGAFRFTLTAAGVLALVAVATSLARGCSISST